MRGFRYGFGLGRGKGGTSSAPAFTAFLIGLSTDSLGTYGQIGNHASISYTIDPDNSSETVKWSNSSNPADAATFGTGINPTTFASVDGFSVYLHVTDSGETRTYSFSARYAPGAAAAIADGQAWTVDAAITPIDASASGANLTFSYGATGLPAGVSIDSGTGSITGTPTSVSAGTATVTATDQYGRTYVDTFTWDVAVAITYTDTSPVLMEFVPVVQGDTVADAFPVGVNDLSNFQSSAGTIVSVVREYNLNNAGWVAEDTTAPTLSSPTDAANGSNASTGSVSTDEGNGTLYWVVTTSATSPSAAQVKAGNDHTGTAATDSGSQAVSGTGVQVLSPAPSGLTASTTYYTHFMHEDSNGNQSAVSSADGFTTDAASSAITFLDGDSVNVGSDQTTITRTLDTSGQGGASYVYVAIVLQSGATWATGSGIGTVTIGGNATTLVTGTQSLISTLFRPNCAIFKTNSAVTLGATSDVVWTRAGSNVSPSMSCAAYAVTGTPAEAGYGANTASPANPVVMSQNVASGDHIIGVYGTRNFGTTTGWTGLTSDGVFPLLNDPSGYPVNYGSAANVAAATPRTITYGHDGSGNSVCWSLVVITP